MKICKKGLHEYDSKRRRCPQCQKIGSKLWQQNNRSRVRESCRDYHKINRDKIRLRKSVNYKNNAKEISILMAAYYIENADKIRAKALAYAKANPEKMNAISAKRHAAKLQRTPIWLTEQQYKEMQDWYTLAKELQWLSDQPLEVDHIVPLQGKNVSGLHVPWNLQILTKSENVKKGNLIK